MDFQVRIEIDMQSDSPKDLAKILRDYAGQLDRAFRHGIRERLCSKGLPEAIRDENGDMIGKLEVDA